jgi:aarF domain-containing kinase
MVAEWIDGVRLNDQTAIEKMGFSIPRVIESFISTIGNQIFVTGFVHSDPHPGVF